MPVFCLLLQSQISGISGERIRPHVKFLASDLLEGRGVGTRGGDLATEYIASQFALIGAKPAGDNGTYFQRVPLVGATTLPSASLTAAAAGKTLSLKWLTDFVGVTHQQKAGVKLDAEAIFVGHGIAAPEFQWDDFKGVDVKGKVLVLFTNEPPSDDPAFFGGKALTYYGRWTYKFEQAERMGAAGALIIHTTATAGYGFSVLSSSEGKENPQIRITNAANQLAFAGWITQEAGDKLLHLAGKSVDELLNASNSRDFKPIPLGVRIRGDFPTNVRDIESRNVVAMIPGSDPQLKNEAVVMSAHWDHLGIGPEVNGDAIYNGAVD
ncbi:MAG: M28 family peptidase, partial [Acidobacteriaceae bacterium]|nr:M28 family peptidase [Acidobacteriaceae bacterium]